MKTKALNLTALLFILYTSNYTSAQDNEYPEYKNGCVSTDKMLMGWCPLPDNYSVNRIETDDNGNKVIRFMFFMGDSITGYHIIKNIDENKIQMIALPPDSTAITNYSINMLNNNKSWYIQGIKVILVNTTSDTIKQTLQDGSLRVVQEARDKNDEWSHIEYWANSWCGNSYFSSLTLPPNSYVVFGVYRYTGNYNTKVRCRLSLTGRNGKQVIISNDFDGSINLGQFNKQQKPGPLLEYF